MASRKGIGGRKRVGTLEYRSGSWHVRLTVDADGETIRPWFDLETQSKAIARRKAARLALTNARGAPVNVEAVAADAKRDETLNEAIERVLKLRRAEGIRDIANDQIRLRLHVQPLIGAMHVTAVRPTHIRDVLDEARTAGKSRRTLVHIRRALNIVFDSLWRDEIIAENPVARVKVPRVPEDKRERAVLTDDELAVYLAWQHPVEQHRLAVLERQALACISRMFGGLRTGDLHALRWDEFETEHGMFRRGWAPRKKTARPQLLEVPGMLRPVLRDWWERAGRPAEGLLFPALRGKHAGKGEKVGVSHAKALRRDLRRAFGLETWDPKRLSFVPAVGRNSSAREKELLEGTERVKPVDFHSWRRAYSQALADADVNAQQASALAGHSSLSAHQRYLTNTSKMRTLPAAALPKLSVLSKAWTKLESAQTLSNEHPWLRGEDLNLRPSGYEGEPQFSSGFNDAKSLTLARRCYRPEVPETHRGAKLRDETQPRWRAWEPPRFRVKCGTLRVERVSK